MTSRLRFVPYQDHEDGVQQLRPRRACPQCRHKKKRCNHSMNLAAGETSPLVWKEPRTPLHSKKKSTSAGGRASPGAEGPRSPPLTTDDSQQSQSPGQPQDGEGDCTADGHVGSPTMRFIGDLNPEARLLDKTTSPESAEGTVPGDVGVWVPPPRSACRCSVAGLDRDKNKHRDKDKPSPASDAELGRNGIRSGHPPVSDLVPSESVEGLSDLYFSTMHPVLPLLNETEYRASLSRGATPMPLVHAVCLVAAKHSTADRHLRLLQSSNAAVSTREFCSQLHASITTALTRRGSLRRMTLIRVLGLLSMHKEGPQGMEESSSCVAQAVHYVQSSALHQPRPNDADHELKRVFWCIWVLDRLNAATNSRPCIIQNMDIAVARITPEESGSVAFGVCFRIAALLDVVIGLYRPRYDQDADTGWDTDDFPGFEHILDETDAWQLPEPTLATLHIFYLATAILAHRLKTIATLPSLTPSRLRQRLSAIQVIRYMRDHDRLSSLHPFHFVVYAASLAISVSYQQLRYSRLSSEQDDARQDFEAGCDILQTLRRKWASADTMASLAHRISKALDELPTLAVLRKSWQKEQREIQPQSEDTSMGSTNNSNSNHNSSGTMDSNRDPTGPLAVHLGGQGVLQQQQEMNPLATGTTAQQPQHQQQLSFPETTMDLFSGMDDLSWMYLDGENPVNFESLLGVNLDDPYTSWH